MPPSPPQNPEQAPLRVRWRLAWGVVALQSSLQLGWVLYRAYQPHLLAGHGFAFLLGPFALLPGFLGLLIEPASGALSDRLASTARGRLLPLTLSVLVAGLIFVSVVALLQQGIVAGNILLPVLMVVWMVAVQASSSPNLAQLNEAVSLKDLPRAAALLTLLQGLIGAFSSGLAQGARQLGPAFTFLLGGAVLFLGLAVLRGVPERSGGREPLASGSRPAVPLPRCALLLAISLAVGGIGQVLLELLPRVHARSPQSWHPGEWTPVVLLVSALAAPWAGRLVMRWGRRGTLIRTLPVLAAVLTLALLLPPAFAAPLLPLLGILHSLVLTSLTAVALATLPTPWSGLGAGLVLGGSGLAGSLSLLRFGAEGSLAAAPAVALLLGAAALALGGCLLLKPAGSHAGASAPPG